MKADRTISSANIGGVAAMKAALSAYTSVVQKTCGSGTWKCPTLPAYRDSHVSFCVSSASEPLQDFTSPSKRDEVSLAGVESNGGIGYPLRQHPPPFLRHQGVGGTLIDANRCRHVLWTESPWSNDGEIFVDDAAGIGSSFTHDPG